MFSLALFIPPLAPFLNLIKFSIFMPSGPWTALPLLTSPMSLLVLLLQMLCVPQSRSDVLLGPVSWKGLCACCGTLPVILLLGRVPQGRCLSVSEAAVLHQTGLCSVVRLPRQLGASTRFPNGKQWSRVWGAAGNRDWELVSQVRGRCSGLGSPAWICFVRVAPELLCRQWSPCDKTLL